MSFRNMSFLAKKEVYLKFRRHQEGQKKREVEVGNSLRCHLFCKLSQKGNLISFRRFLTKEVILTS